MESDGAVFPSGGQSDAEPCQLHPVESGGSYSIPHIVVWHRDLDPSTHGKIYVANVDGVFVISWEGVPQTLLPAGLPENGPNFQVALHPGGNIGIRWGDGNPPPIEMVPMELLASRSTTQQE